MADDPLLSQAITPAKVQIEYLDFAKKRMQARGITPDEVEAVIEHHRMRTPRRSSGDLVYEGVRTNGHLLKVRVKRGSSNPLIVVDVVAPA